jgi:hypothetical protein
MADDEIQGEADLENCARFLCKLANAGRSKEKIDAAIQDCLQRYSDVARARADLAASFRTACSDHENELTDYIQGILEI